MKDRALQSDKQRSNRAKQARTTLAARLLFAGMFLVFMLSVTCSVQAQVNATLVVGGSEQLINGAWDEGNITVAFNGFSETVHYEQFSSSASIASALGAKFSNDYIAQGLCAIASGSTITFHLKATAVPPTFGPLSISNPSASFSFSPSGWANGGQISLTVVCSPSSFTVGQTTNCSAQLSPAGPTGTVSFGVDSPDDPLIWQTDDVNTSGTATASGGLGDLPAGTYRVTAYYSGDSTYSPASASAQVTVTGTGGGSGTPLYSYTVAYQPNGVVGAFSDSVMGTWTADYDSLNRLLGIEEATPPIDPNSPKAPFTNYCWGYDSFGNRTVSAASTSEFPSDGNGNFVCSPQSYPASGYNANNQVYSGPAVPSYDAAGNVTAENNGDGFSYLYDAEGRICAVQNPPLDGFPQMMGYVYDAEGRRVAKGTITSWSCDPSTNGFASTGSETDYLLDQSGNQVTEMTGASGNMTWVHTNVWAGGRLLGTYQATTDANQQADGELHFYMTDWLGSRRVQVNYAGTWENECVSLPFGDEESCQSTPTEHLFTGKERDAESGNDYFGARYYASTMGRWLSPDPSNLGVDIYLPQTWNRYNYAVNNPLSIADRNGLWPFYIHNEIIDESFPGMSREDLQTLKDASWNMDFGKGQQDPANAYMHGMSDGLTNEDPGEARQDADNYIAEQVQDAQMIESQWLADGHSGIAPAALTAFGNALHTTTDRISPSHRGEQPWRNKPWHSKETMTHVLGESTINAAQMSASKAAAQSLFARTFGGFWPMGNWEWMLLPPNHPEEHVTIRVCDANDQNCH